MRIAIQEFKLGTQIERVTPDLILTHLPCLLYTSDAADERSSVDLGGRRIIKKKKYIEFAVD